MAADIRLDGEVVAVDGILRVDAISGKGTAGVGIDGRLHVTERVTMRELLVNTPGVEELVASPDNPMIAVKKKKTNPPTALRHTLQDKLEINPDLEYTGGVRIAGHLEVAQSDVNRLHATRLDAEILSAHDLRTDALSVTDQAALPPPPPVVPGDAAPGDPNHVMHVGANGHPLAEEARNPLAVDRDASPPPPPPVVRKALAHLQGDRLVLNPDESYTGGVVVNGAVRVPARLVVGNLLNGIRASKDDITIRTTKLPPASEASAAGSADDGAGRGRGRNPSTDRRFIVRGVMPVIEQELRAELRPIEDAWAGLLPTVYEFDLVEQIYELRAEIAALKAKIAELGVDR